MKTSILNTEFNFAKSINLSLIAAPKAYPSYPQGIREFITPYLEEIEPDFTFNIKYITFQVYFD